MEQIVNFSEPREKNALLARLRLLTGLHRITDVKHKERRSDRQNRWYWPCFVAPFADYLRECGNEVTDEEAHGALKFMFLRKTVTNNTTGETLDTVQSSAELDTGAFNEYLEKCAAFLIEECGITPPDANLYRERK